MAFLGAMHFFTAGLFLDHYRHWRVNGSAMESLHKKNSQILMWSSYCSAFLLEEKYSLGAINLEENSHPKLRQAWLDFSKEHRFRQANVRQ